MLHIESGCSYNFNDHARLHEALQTWAQSHCHKGALVGLAPPEQSSKPTN